MRFDDWIKEVGPKEVAKKLKVDVSTVSHWRNGDAFPRARFCKQIFQMSEGRVSYGEMVEHSIRSKVSR